MEHAEEWPQARWRTQDFAVLCLLHWDPEVRTHGIPPASQTCGLSLYRGLQ